MARRRMAYWIGFLALCAWLSTAGGAVAQLRMPTSDTKDGAAPITFTADQVEYDNQRGIVTVKGAVEAWRADRILRADEIVFDRATGQSVAKGGIVLIDPSGQTMFASYAELDREFKNGIFKDVGALLPDNARMAANGMRRTEGTINELSHVVYSTCNICVDDPKRPPVWQIKAKAAIQDTEHQMIEYKDASMELLGVPVAYFPYFTHPDPSVPRRSGLLLPVFGNSSSIGAFFGQPYYWAIDQQSDMTILPMMTTRSGPYADVQYRRAFNTGTFLANGSLGETHGKAGGTFVLRGQFNYDDTWRWGFDINRASSISYLRNFHNGEDLNGSLNTLPSTVYLEGFGEGSYTRLDATALQSLSTTIADSKLPVVAPRYMYSYFGEPDRFGGRLKVDLGAFNLRRDDGTETRRANIAVEWSRRFVGALGDLWKIAIHGDAATYSAARFGEQPNFAPVNSVSRTQALPQISLGARWPFYRDSGEWGSQLIEPMVEIVAAPRMGDSQVRKIPNEDSFDFEFSDQNLFGFNRFPGIDRLEGGTRLNAALHGAWYLGGTAFDGLVGQSYRTFKDSLFPAASGLHDQVSDVVLRGTFSPSPLVDITYRTRLDAKTLNARMMEGSASFGPREFRIGGGYTYSTINPYFYYAQSLPPPISSAVFQPRNEASVNVSSEFGQYRFTGFARRDLSRNEMVAWGGDLIYEDECLIVDFKFRRRYTTFLYEPNGTTLLLLFTFKTVGTVGYRAL